MNYLKQLKKRLHSEPSSFHVAVFGHLIQSLYRQEPLKLSVLYELDHEDFKLALAILNNWRLDRFTEKKEQLWELTTATPEWSPPDIGQPGATTNRPLHREAAC